MQSVNQPELFFNILGNIKPSERFKYKNAGMM